MENITLGQVVVAIGIISTIFGVILRIYKIVSNASNDRKEMIDSIRKMNDRIDNLKETINKRIDDLDEGQCKNYMSRFLKDKEQGRPVDDVEEERFWEIYDHYINPKENGGLGLNSYFHKKVDKLQKEGKL